MDAFEATGIQDVNVLYNAMRYVFSTVRKHFKEKHEQQPPDGIRASLGETVFVNSKKGNKK